ncbi:uncharacterized protein METZ01_LOCUS134440 [marine metagenome]|uniref:Uncharacterized protein n=1 Tax=marine metagenome TaxID=408172 RepID=A0A381YX19_9ZZZZ
MAKNVYHLVVGVEAELRESKISGDIYRRESIGESQSR